jgi:hypothetical protein
MSLQRAVDDIGKLDDEGAHDRLCLNGWPDREACAQAAAGAWGQIAWINDAVGDPEMHAHLLEFDTVHGRWDAAFAHDADSVSINGARLPFIGTRDLSDLPLDGVDVVIDCTGVFKTEAALAPYFAAGVKKVVVSAPVKDGDAANIVYGVNTTSTTRAPPDRHGGVLHHELPRPGGQGGPRDPRHPPRLDHHDPRRDQHPDHRRPPRQGPAPRAVGAELPDPDDDRKRHRDHADLPGAEGSPERPRGAGAAPERLAHRLRVRAGARDDDGRGQRPLQGRGGRAAERHPGYETRPLVSPTTPTTRGPRSSTAPRPWS